MGHKERERDSGISNGDITRGHKNNICRERVAQFDDNRSEFAHIFINNLLTMYTFEVRLRV